MRISSLEFWQALCELLEARGWKSVRPTKTGKDHLWQAPRGFKGRRGYTPGPLATGPAIVAQLAADKEKLDTE